MSAVAEGLVGELPHPMRYSAPATAGNALPASMMKTRLSINFSSCWGVNKTCRYHHEPVEATKVNFNSTPVSQNCWRHRLRQSSGRQPPPLRIYLAYRWTPQLESAGQAPRRGS